LLLGGTPFLAGCGGRVEPPGGALLLVSNRSGPFRIYTVGPDEGTARLVGSRRADDRSYDDSMPARLPDGRIVFVSDRDGNLELYLASPDGHEVERLTNDPPDPASAVFDVHPAPLGRDRIVFARGEPGAPRGAPMDLYEMALDGTGLRRLTRHPASDYAPCGSADGSSVVFISERGGVPRMHRIVEVAAAAPEAIAVDLPEAAGLARTLFYPGAAFADAAPACLPDGSIIFARTPSGGTSQLYGMAATGASRGLRQITDERILPFGAGEPVLLSDGTILFVAGPIVTGEGAEEKPRYSVYRIAAGGFNLERISRQGAGYDDFSRRLSSGPRADAVSEASGRVTR
jgi:TolB protein